MSVGPLLRRILSWGIIVAAAVFLYVTIARNWRQLAGYDWEVAPGLLVASLLLHVTGLAWGVHIWSRVLRKLDAPEIRYGQLLRIWSASNLTKYIPGAVWQFMTAAHLSRGQGLAAVVAMSSMVIHVGFSLLTAIAVAAVTFPLDPRFGIFSEVPTRVAVVALTMVAVHPWAINRALGVVPRALGRELLGWNGRWRDGLGIFLLSAGSWLLYGAAFSLFVASLAPIGLDAVVPLLAVNALAFTAGYLALIAPGGIGVRESAMALLLTPILPMGVAAILAIGARLWAVIGELILAAAGVAASHGRG